MPPKQRNEQERQETRTRILDAARILFVEHGIEATSMREIAGRVGCSATAIYLYFRDKRDLFRALCATDFLALAEEMRQMERIVDPMERLHRLGIGYARFALSHPNHYRLMFMTRWPQLAADELGIEQGNPEQDAYAQLYGMVAEAHAAGRFRADLDDPALVAQTLWAGVHGVCSLEITLGEDGWTDWRPFEARIGLMVESLMRAMARLPEVPHG
ncbi:MAG: TetR/AcrR family transcriptional regulator [Gallionellaceae bacterium]|nr:TetR/AcrR family transcriptional regulator [Gallionellaceae bacterium]